MAIAQLERDPAMIERIVDFVGSGFPILADPAQVSVDHFEIFDVYIADKQGQLRWRIPGSKAARPRLDVILATLESLQNGDDAPAVNEPGRVRTVAYQSARAAPPADVVSVRWMWSHDVVRPGDNFKLALLPTVADGFHVYGQDSELTVPFSLQLVLPEGLTQKHSVQYPAPRIEQDPVLEVELPIYEGDIPVSAFQLSAGYDIDPGDYQITARLSYQACDDELCLAPVVHEVTLPLKVADRESDRAQVFGWETW